MKKLFSTLICIITCIALGLNVSAKQCKYNGLFNKVLSDSDITKSAVHISFKELGTNKQMYELNSKTPVPAGSIQKILTYTVAKDKLGNDYKFSTKLYKNSSEDYFIVLGADPFLTTTDLKSLLVRVNSKINSLHIDDTIVDDKEWGEGWQWDDDMNPFMPKFSAYNLDGNLLKIFVIPTRNGAPANIQTNIFYPLAFENYTVTITGESDVKFVKRNYISPDVITVSGQVGKTIVREIPINYPKRSFKLRIEEILRKHKTPFYGEIKYEKIPQEYTLVNEITHPMKRITDSILKNSDNLVAESFFKVASYGTAKEEKAENSLSGTTENSIELFNKYCEKAKLNNSEIRIVDGSGVSKNNLLTAEFITDFLVYNSNSELKTDLPTAGEGTLKNRMLYLKDKIHAKTGTLANISAITGYLETKKQNNYAFCIIINSPKVNEADMKMLEEYILREAYLNM